MNPDPASTVEAWRQPHAPPTVPPLEQPRSPLTLCWRRVNRAQRPRGCSSPDRRGPQRGGSPDELLYSHPLQQQPRVAAPAPREGRLAAAGVWQQLPNMALRAAQSAGEKRWPRAKSSAPARQELRKKTPAFVGPSSQILVSRRMGSGRRITGRQ